MRRLPWRLVQSMCRKRQGPTLILGRGRCRLESYDSPLRPNFSRNLRSQPTTPEAEKMVNYSLMEWTITYRGRGGGQEQMSLEAETRELAFSELEKRGLVAVRIEQASSGTCRKTASRNLGVRAASSFRGLVAGAVVVVAALVMWLLLSQNWDGAPTTSREGKAPMPVPATSPASVPAKATEPKEERLKSLPPQRIGETRDGKVLLPDGTLHTVKGVITSGVARVSLIDRTFKHDTDCMLAHLLTVEPGEEFVGDSESIYSGFEKEFLKTLDDPIVYDKSDSDYVKELKMGVQALRQELKEIHDRGESIEKALIETRDQLQQLGLYRQELEQHVLSMSADGMSHQDYEDLVAAANKMLEERGSKPLELPSTVKHAARLGRLIRNSEAKESNK